MNPSSTTITLNSCSVCGGKHLVTLCPQVEEIEFYESGAIKKVKRKSSTKPWRIEDVPQEPYRAPLGHPWPSVWFSGDAPRPMNQC